MMDNKLIEIALVMEYVWDEIPVSCMRPSRLYIPTICSAKKDGRTGMVHHQ